MTEVTRRQVAAAAAWTVPVVAVGTATPAHAASQPADHCACFAAPQLTLEKGRWRADLRIGPGTSFELDNKLHYEACGIPDRTDIDFEVEDLTVRSTEGLLDVDSTVTWMSGQSTSGSLPLRVLMHFASPSWQIGSSASHHVTEVTVTARVTMADRTDSQHVICPTPLTFNYQLGPDSFGSWDGNGGEVTVSVS